MNEKCWVLSQKHPIETKNIVRTIYQLFSVFMKKQLIIVKIVNLIMGYIILEFVMK